MRFYECNGNRPFADYDAVARRKGAEPNFSYADKIIIPKIFNLATPKLDNERPDKQEQVTLVLKLNKMEWKRLKMKIIVTSRQELNRRIKSK